MTAVSQDTIICEMRRSQWARVNNPRSDPHERRFMITLAGQDFLPELKTLRECETALHGLWTHAQVEDLKIVERLRHSEERRP